MTPPAGERLDRAIDTLMPRIRITDLLWDVNAQTGFLDAFTDLRSGRLHANPAALLAAILAGATNLGLERMAQASRSVSHAQLSWASNWYLRSETYADALARIIDAHHALPFARIWGNVDRTSSDGQFFASGTQGRGDQREIWPGPRPEDLLIPVGAVRLVPCQRHRRHRRRGAFRPGRARGKTPPSFNPLVHYVDTGGVSDHVFALFHLLGLVFAPRLRDFPERRLACFGRPGQWKGLAPIMGKPINETVIRDHWGDVLRLTASIKNQVRQALGDPQEAGRLPATEPPVPRTRRDRPH